MDEIVFQREALRRRLLEVIELLAKAREAYDPESDFPIDDFMAALTAASLRTAVCGYGEAVADRVKTRADARKRQ